MPTVLQFRRGTTSQNNNFTGAAGEISIDTDLDTIRVHDGSTAGGFEIVGKTATQTLTNKTLDGAVLTGTLTANSGVGSSGQYLESTGSGVRWSTVDATKITNGTSNVAVASGGAISFTVAGTTILSVDGTGIINNQADGVGNIGNDSTGFNTVFAKATSAQYADLAEKYESDAVYEPGTVIVIGGDKEVTQSTTYADSATVGVVSTNPAHIMNSSIQAEISIDLALTGRVPCRVVGNISKGDVLTSSNVPGVATKLNNADFKPGCVLGKALEAYSNTEPGVIEVLVGQL